MPQRTNDVCLHLGVRFTGKRFGDLFPFPLQLFERSPDHLLQKDLFGPKVVEKSALAHLGFRSSALQRQRGRSVSGDDFFGRPENCFPRIFSAACGRNMGGVDRLTHTVALYKKPAGRYSKAKSRFKHAEKEILSMDPRLRVLKYNDSCI